MKPYDGGTDYGVWLCSGNQDKLAELIQKHDVRTVLEIGTCYGASAIWFARQPGIERVVCVDLWCAIPEHGIPANVFDIFVANVRKAGMQSKIVAVRGDSHLKSTLEMVVNATMGQSDLTYFDGDHTYHGVKLDLRMYGAGKVLAGDDYDANLPSVAGVIKAVDECVPDRKVHGRLWWKEIA